MDLTVSLHQPHRRTELFGPADRFLRRIRDELAVRIHTRNATLRLTGDPGNVARAAAVLEKLQKLLRHQDYLSDDDIDAALSASAPQKESESLDTIAVFSRGGEITAKTDGQRHYVHALRRNDLVFCLGPAGTGKTYLAVAMAVNRLKTGKTKRIILARPAVEAGEKLGFLPGDLQQKVNPYLRPVFDALLDMMTYDQMKRFMVSDVIEVVPLAFMRGRTLNHSIIILDEAQNTTRSQMLMFLTRLGRESKMIVAGDDSQTDLEGETSGLTDAVARLRGTPGIDIVHLTDLDIVRHPLVQEVVNRYGRQGGGRETAARDLPNDGSSSAAN